jgi:hypothetical protein
MPVGSKTSNFHHDTQEGIGDAIAFLKKESIYCEPNEKADFIYIYKPWSTEFYHAIKYWPTTGSWIPCKSLKTRGYKAYHSKNIEDFVTRFMEKTEEEFYTRFEEKK